MKAAPLRERMKALILISGLLVFATPLPAAPSKTVNVGDTREEVLAALGEPQGSLRQGLVEVFVYKGGVDVELRQGRVIKVTDAKAPVTVAPPFAATRQGVELAAVTKQPNRVSDQPALGKIIVNPLAKVSGQPLTSGRRALVIAGYVLAVAGLLSSFAAGIWFLMRAFRVHLGWGFACLFLPLAQVVFVVKHWKEGGKPFLISLGAGAAGGLGLFLAIMVASAPAGRTHGTRAPAQVAIKQTAPAAETP
jgi:hypothetical protein